MNDVQFVNAILQRHADTTAKYSAPAIVRERCPFCHGAGLREIGTGPLAQLDTCGCCVGRGYIAVEAP